MTKDISIEDYLHLYLGCECKTPLGIMVLSSIDLHYQYPVWFRYKEKSRDKKGRITYSPQVNFDVLITHGLRGRAFHFSEVKPILRPLSDMTEEEINELWAKLELNPDYENDSYGFKKKDYLSNFFTMKPSFPSRIEAFGWNKIPTLVSWLLSKHFDLFGLIEAGLAIDKTTLTSRGGGGGYSGKKLNKII